MESYHIEYDYLKSFDRIDAIISESDNSFEDAECIPPRDRLTFSNGFYVNCTALFVDIRGSSGLPESHKRPKLAKLYRAYISEVVAVMNGNTCCAEVSIVGDCVSAVFDTPYNVSINSVFTTAAQIGSLIDVLDCKFQKHGIEGIKIGIGMSYGRALMIKAGYKGSSINDVVWMGNVLNEASKLCDYAHQNRLDCELMVSSRVHGNLSDHNKGLLAWNTSRSCYHGTVINSKMNEWYKANCE